MYFALGAGMSGVAKVSIFFVFFLVLVCVSRARLLLRRMDADAW